MNKEAHAMCRRNLGLFLPIYPKVYGWMMGGCPGDCSTWLLGIR